MSYVGSRMNLYPKEVGMLSEEMFISPSFHASGQGPGRLFELTFCPIHRDYESLMKVLYEKPSGD